SRVESHVDVQLAETWRSAALLRRLDVPGFDANDAAMSADPNETANRQRFDQPANALDADHPSRFDRLHQRADFIGVRRDHQRRSGAFGINPSEEIPVRIDLHILAVWIE